MNTVQGVTGFCPTQNKNFTISVAFIDASTLDRQQYVKGLFTCDHIKHGNGCDIAKECPVYNIIK
jgi:hypothetical protein